MTRYVMAVDAGTGSGRAVIYDLRGSMVGIAQEEWTHRVVSGVPGALDFDTLANGMLIDRVIARALADAGVAAREIAAVSTTSMREGVVLYDGNGVELWACPNVDARAQAEARELVETGIADRIYDVGGDWVSITAPARLRWVAKHHPDVIARTRHLGLISDWLASRLTGEFYTEPSAGSSTALFDLSRRHWSDDFSAPSHYDRMSFRRWSRRGHLWAGSRGAPPSARDLPWIRPSSLGAPTLSSPFSGSGGRLATRPLSAAASGRPRCSRTVRWSTRAGVHEHCAMSGRMNGWSRVSVS